MQPPIKAAPLPPGPDNRDARIVQLEQLVEVKEEEIKELTRKIEEAGAQVQELNDENVIMHRVLDGEDLLGNYKKEVAAVAERARVAEARQRGLMVENADLAKRLKSALRRLEKKPVEAA